MINKSKTKRKSRWKLQILNIISLADTHKKIPNIMSIVVSVCLYGNNLFVDKKKSLGFFFGGKLS